MSWREQLDVGELTVHEENKVTANVGVPVNGVAVATEYGDARKHLTKLVISSTLPAIVGGTNLGLGKLIYTFPAGIVIVHGCYMSMALDEVDGNITNDAPEAGIGSVIAVGAVIALDTPATFEDFLSGVAMDDCNGTVELAGSESGRVVDAADAHTVHFNVADGWAASGEAACPIAGTVWLDWTFVGA